MLPTWFKGAEGTAGVVFVVMAAAAWLLLPLAHPVYGVVIPPVLGAGAAYAVWRVRRKRAGTPTIRSYQGS